MDDFKTRFGQYHPDTNTYSFSNVRSGLIVGLVGPFLLFFFYFLLFYFFIIFFTYK